MEELKKTIEFVTIAELNRANKKFPMFHSQHEGYAIILEEFQEAEQELEDIKKHLNFAWHYIKQNNSETTLELINLLKKKAILLACEAVQTAAMAQKFIDSLKDGEIHE